MFKKTIIASALLLASTSAFAVPLNICSGSEGGFYEATMKSIASAFTTRYKGKAPVEVTVENTPGTIYNLNGMADGSCDMAIVQADGLVQMKNMPAGIHVTNAHTEVVYFLINKHAHKEAGIDDIEDIEGSKDWHLAVVEGSGAIVTLRKFVEEDNGYKANLDNAVEFMDMYDAAEAVASGEYRTSGKVLKIAGMLYVSRKGAISNDILEDFRKDLIVGEATDGDFNDATDANGDQLYKVCNIESADLQGMSGATFGNQKTVCVKAQIIYNTNWLNNFEGKDKREAKKALKKAVNGVAKHLR